MEGPVKAAICSIDASICSKKLLRQAIPEEIDVKEVLSGWINIANYIGTCVSTAQRYEHALDLPIYRRGNGPRPPVYALKSELDRWLRGTAAEHIGREMREDFDQRPNLFTSGDGALLARIMDRIHTLTNVTLYRRDYHMVFALQRTSRGVRANIDLTFELVNATNDGQSYIQEITIDDCEHGHVIEMAVLKDGVVIYALKNPAPTKKEPGYSVYHGKKLMIEPESSGVPYMCHIS
ncbi:MAG TPA: hypothetical protein VMU57_01360, partial [Edaphobacter sp.]|uniref:hypothetical protein n=1 Tax=Edaphobacter sp. TaxID=1934404 RepID=UPI002BAD2FFF